MTAAASARSILTQLHEVMASRMHAQGKLDRVVEIIGETLDSEVCSIYLLREGMLELFATRGLNKEAVHVTRLALGEGLTGTIADRIETLNLAEAKAHPDFQYRPETGELEIVCKVFVAMQFDKLFKGKIEVVLSVRSVFVA